MFGASVPEVEVAALIAGFTVVDTDSVLGKLSKEFL